MGVCEWFPCCDKDKESEAGSDASGSSSEDEEVSVPGATKQVPTSILSKKGAANTKRSVTMSSISSSRGPPTAVQPQNSIVSAEEKRLYDENEGGDSVFFPPGLLDQLAENELEAPGMAKSTFRSVTPGGSMVFGTPKSLVVNQSGRLRREVTAMATSAMSKSFAFQAGRLPDAVEPSNQEPVGDALIEGVSVSDVLRSLKTNSWPMATFLEKTVDASDIADSKWAIDDAIADTKVRRLQYTMPVPADVPAAIKRLISLPEFSKVTTVYRLRGDGDSVNLVAQTTTHDVAFGENFCVQETLAFRSRDFVPHFSLDKMQAGRLGRRQREKMGGDRLGETAAVDARSSEELHRVEDPSECN